LTNNFFNQSLLKLRIKMLHKSRSTETALMKYGLIAPLFMLMIVVSSATLATKPIDQIEEMVKEVSAKDAPMINDNSVAEELTENNYNDPNVDLSKAYVISPALVDEVKAIQESKRDTNDVFDAVDQQAEYQGGMNAFVNFMQENIKYPAPAQRANVSGKVYTQFIVNTDGTISDVTILKSVGFGCDEEAMRVIKLAKWTPGKQSGQVVRSRFTVPINFQLAKSSEVFNAVDQQGEYPGGMVAFAKYLQENLKYPAAAQRANKSGKVYVQFIINTDGTASDFNVLKSVGFGLDEEALRVISSVPKWTPAIQSGRVVRSRFTIPINFQLSE
jgi:TonB family protein